MKNKNNKKTKEERLKIILEICKKLKQFPKTNTYVNDPNPFVDLYNSEYDAIKYLKNVFNDYLNQDDSKPKLLIGFNGKIKFPEINKQIEYILPIVKTGQSLCIFKHLD